MNMDYAACMAANYNASDIYGMLLLLIIYDIACQWAIHFLERISGNKYTHFDQDRELKVAVGKFHLGSHVNSCFAKHSLNFVRGSGQIDGEIMETLWAYFNMFAPITRVMTLAHRAEILNDHMQDVNHKKMLGMGKGVN